MNFYVSFKGQKEMTKTVFDCKHHLWEAGGAGGVKRGNIHIKELLERLTLLPQGHLQKP